jgi:hypothetical protein
VQTMAEHHAAMAEKAADLAVAQQQVQPQPVVPLPAMVQP